MYVAQCSVVGTPICGSVGKGRIFNQVKGAFAGAALELEIIEPDCAGGVAVHTNNHPKGACVLNGKGEGYPFPLVHVGFGG